LEKIEKIKIDSQEMDAMMLILTIMPQSPLILQSYQGWLHQYFHGLAVLIR